MSRKPKPVKPLPPAFTMRQLQIIRQLVRVGVAEVVAEAVRNRMAGLTQTFAGKQRRGGCG